MGNQHFFVGTMYWGNVAFEKTKIHQVCIPEWVMVIEQDTFGDCFSLNSWLLPDSLERIKDNAFRFCLNVPLSLFMPINISSIISIQRLWITIQKFLCIILIRRSIWKHSYLMPIRNSCGKRIIQVFILRKDLSFHLEIC